MLDWIPQAARELRGEFVDLYWSALVVVTLVVIVLSFFKVAEGNINPRDIIKRVVFSILMLWSFDEVINAVGIVTDGLADKLGGTEGIKALYGEIKKRYAEDAPSLFNFRQMSLYAINMVCYLVALLGYYMTEVLINFAYTILYVLSPLMILAYVPQATAHITTNLYKGLLEISFWKILWCLLGVLLHKLATVPDGGGWDSVLMQAMMNFCIGFSMLAVPFFAKSLLGDGLVGMSLGVGSSLTRPISAPVKALPSRLPKAVGKKSMRAMGLSGRRTKKKAQRLKKQRTETRQQKQLDALKARASTNNTNRRNKTHDKPNPR